MHVQDNSGTHRTNKHGPSILRGWSVKARIAALSVLAVVGIGGLGGTYLIGDAMLVEEDAVVRQYEEMERHVAAIDAGMLQLRRREKDFILRHDEKYVDVYRETAVEISAALQAVRALDISQSVSREMDFIDRKLAEHRAAFESLVATVGELGIDENAGLQGSLRSAVRELETMLATHDFEALTVKMLMMRRHEKDFMLRGDDKYIARIDSRREEFASLLTEMPISEVEKREISTLLENYVADFKAYTTKYGQERDLRKKLSDIYAEVEPHLESLHVIGRQGSDEAWAIADEIRGSTRLGIVAVGGAILTVFLVFAIGLTRSITVPLRAMTSAMVRLADGDTAVDVPGVGRGDEIGEMARTVLVFKDNAQHRARLEQEKKEEAERAKRRRKEIIDQLMSDFDRQVAEGLNLVASSASELEQTAQQMSATAEETSRQAGNVATASDQASANVQTVATTAEELSASIAEIGRQVTQSARIASNAVQEAAVTNATVQNLSEAAAKIGEVVTLINDIAGQTNLLALNATIEAARAGDAGKGFAVVAQEVKNLANQTAKATEEISQQVASVQEETTDAVVAIEKITGIISEINDISTTIASAIEEQGLSTKEIARNVQQAAQGTQDVNTNIESVNRAAGDTGTAASQVLGASRDMARHAEGLRSQVDLFLEGIKAA